MSLKKACIVSDIGGPRDIIEDDVDGFRIEPGNEKLLAEKLVYLIENPDKRKQF